jgi:hypothetical protein
MAPMGKLFGIADCCYERRGHHGANAFDLRQFLAGGALLKSDRLQWF